MVSTYLSSTQLFLINGIIEGLVGILAIVNPKVIPSVKKLHQHGKIYAGFFGPMLFAMSFVSVLMAKLEDSNNDAKHLFAFGWVIYHIGASFNCFKAFFGGKRAMVGGLVFHSFLLASFAMYLMTNNFKIDLLFPF
eukprot:237170_1